MTQYQAVAAGCILLFAGLIDMRGTTAARGSFAAEQPWAAEHIDALPNDIRREISKYEQLCGSKALAGHYFAVSIEAGIHKFVSLHFEDFACAKRAAVCNADGCLHEVFVESRGGHRLVFNAYARDVKLSNDRGVIGLRVEKENSTFFLRWNGRSFFPAVE